MGRSLRSVAKSLGLERFHRTIGQILGLPADPSERNFPTLETEGLPFIQEFYSVIESRCGRFVSPFPDEPRIDPVGARGRDRCIFSVASRSFASSKLMLIRLRTSMVYLGKLPKTEWVHC